MSSRKTKVAEGNDAAVIRAGGEAITQWRKENTGLRLSAERLIATDLDLSGADLSRADLGGGCFVRCDLRHVSFANSNLNTTEFNHCRLDDADFRGANLRGCKIIAKSLSGARFGSSPCLGRIAEFHVVDPVVRPIEFDRCGLPWFDRWLGWDRLRFLATIRIFVPAYASLTLTVLYLKGIASYNSAAGFINEHLSRGNGLALLPLATAGWTDLLVLINFSLLAVAATSFLGCPPRVVEFTRERWLNELLRPQILYEYTTWQRPSIRMLCIFSLIAGGGLSSFLLARVILKEALFIISRAY